MSASSQPTATETIPLERLKALEERGSIILERARRLLSDPLSRETRNERKSLLAVSALGIVVVKTGLVPSRITALGIEFSPADKIMLLRVIAAIVAYFILAFVVYAWADYLAWQTTFRVLILARMRERLIRGNLAYVRGLPRENASLIRMVFEFVFPIAIAIYGIVLLLR